MPIFKSMSLAGLIFVSGVRTLPSPLEFGKKAVIKRLLPCLALLALIQLSGCSSQVSEPTVGQYRAVLELPGGEAPFGLEVARENNAFVLYLQNGNERTRVPEVSI